MKNLDEYLDARGLPIHRPKYPNLLVADGGDSLNRLSHMYFCKSVSMMTTDMFQLPGIKEEFRNKLMLYKIYNDGSVVYSRYPWFIDNQWSYLKNDLFDLVKDSLLNKEGQVKWACGRDQLKPVTIACKELGLEKEYNELIDAQKARLGRYQNFDVSWFEGNLYLYIQTRLCMRRLEKDPNDVGDFLNLIMELIYKRRNESNNFWVNKAVKYVNDKNEKTWAMVLWKYFNPSDPFPLSAPPIDSLYQPLIERYLL